MALSGDSGKKVLAFGTALAVLVGGMQYARGDAFTDLVNTVKKVYRAQQTLKSVDGIVKDLSEHSFGIGVVDLYQKLDGLMQWPLDNKYTVISSDYGMRLNPPIPGTSPFHDGIDMNAPLGTPIYASYDGTVAQTGGSENLVTLDHGNGVVTRYLHCNKLNVKWGQPVKKGDTIAWVGNRGHSLGPHLHYEVLINAEIKDGVITKGVKIDPKRLREYAGINFTYKNQR